MTTPRFRQALANYCLLGANRGAAGWTALVMQRYAPFGYFQTEAPTLASLRTDIRDRIAELERPIGASEDWYRQ